MKNTKVDLKTLKLIREKLSLAHENMFPQNIATGETLLQEAEKLAEQLKKQGTTGAAHEFYGRLASDVGLAYHYFCEYTSLVRLIEENNSDLSDKDRAELAYDSINDCLRAIDMHLNDAGRENE